MSNILIVGLNFHPEPIGIGKYTGELASYLAANGHEVHVITTPPYYPFWKVQSNYQWWNYKEEIWQNVEITRCPLWVPGKPTGLKRLCHLLSFALSSIPALISQYSWKPDIVLCIAPSLLNAPSSLLFARVSKAKAWLHIQDFEIAAALNLGILPSNHLLSIIANKIEIWLMQGFDQISTISHKMVNLLCQKGIPLEKTYLFPNWVDTKVIFPFDENRSLFRKERNIPENKIAVLYSGNISHKQGLEYFIDAAKLLHNQTQIHFVICGEGMLRSELEKTAIGYDNIQFLPLEAPENLNLLLNSADIHILTQRADAADLVMPSKLSGILASGKPVIATAKPGTELFEIIKKIGIVVPPENSEALAQSILDLSRSEEKMHLLGKAGINWVTQYWSSENILGDICAKIELHGK